MNKNYRLAAFYLVALITCGAIFGCLIVGFAAIPNNTIRQNAGAVMPTFNATGAGYFVGPNMVISATRAATFVTVDTGQGANDLYPMDQAARTTDDVQFHSIDVQELNLNSVNKMDVLAYPVTEASYIIWTDVSTYYAKNGTTGVIDFSGVDAGAITQSIVDVFIARSRGGVIFYLPGIFNFSTSVSFDLLPAGLGIIFRGSGHDETILKANSANMNLFESANVDVWFSSWENLQFAGRGVGDASGSGINLGVGILSDCSIKDCFFQAFKDYGIYAGAWNTNIRGNIIEYCGTGIQIQSAGGGDVKIIQNKFLYNYETGLSTYRLERSDIIGNFFQRNGGAALYLGLGSKSIVVSCNVFNANGEKTADTYYTLYGYSMMDCIISDNIISGVITLGSTVYSKQGIYARGSYNIISNNIVFNHLREGIYGYELYDSIISDNIVYSNSQKTDNIYDGIRVEFNSDRNVLSGNFVYKGDDTNKQRYGIRIEDATSEDNIVKNNKIINGGSTAAFSNTATNTKVEGNEGYIAPGEPRFASGSLTAGVVNAICFTWNNPEAQDILIKKVVIEVTTGGGTVGSHLDVGIADDAAGTNRGTEFFDDLLLNTAQIDDSWVAGDGGTQTKWVFAQDSASATDDWVVGQILDANAASLVGKYYIEYVGR